MSVVSKVASMMGTVVLMSWMEVWIAVCGERGRGWFDSEDETVKNAAISI